MRTRRADRGIMPKHDRSYVWYVLVEVVRTCGLGVFAIGCANVLTRGTGAGTSLLIGGLVVMLLSAAGVSLARRSATPQHPGQRPVESASTSETWAVARSR